LCVVLLAILAGLAVTQLRLLRANEIDTE